ncbi:MAG: OsmC family protein [Rhizobiales bacterium]|nr:OsmC family protein [Hyphomicrobiales bacterium]
MTEQNASRKGSSRVIVGYVGKDELLIDTGSTTIKGFLPRQGVMSPKDVCDGSDPGIRPGELLLGSLGTCIAGMMAIFARSHGYPLDGISVALTDVMAENPARIGGIDVSVSILGDLSAEQRAKLQKIAAACKVSDSLKHPMRISVSFDTVGAEGG